MKSVKCDYAPDSFLKLSTCVKYRTNNQSMKQTFGSTYILFMTFTGYYEMQAPTEMLIIELQHNIHIFKKGVLMMII